LLDEVTEVAEVEIYHQSSRLAFDEQEAVTRMRHWRFDSGMVPSDAPPDSRRRDGRATLGMRYHHVDVAFHFVTFGVSKPIQG
jgi:hypothetical protein